MAHFGTDTLIAKLVFLVINCFASRDKKNEINKEMNNNKNNNNNLSCRKRVEQWEGRGQI